MGPLALVEIVVLLLLSVTALALGGAMAAKPTQRRYELLRPVTWATVFTCLCAMGSGLANTAVVGARHPWGVETLQTVFAGVAEALVPGTFGFGMLAVAWALAAVGLRRIE